MYIDQRKRKDGSVLICITYIDPKTKKRVRLSRDQHPEFSTVEEAERWIKTQDAALHASRQRSLEKLAWREKFYKFEDYIEKFENWFLMKAPNDSGCCRQRLEHYVFSFFLGKKLANNVNQWRYFYSEFRTFLDNEAISIRFNKPLSYSYKNHVIHTLNQFTLFMVEHNYMDPEARSVCQHFPSHKIGSRTVEDVLTDDEFKDVYVKLLTMDQEVADFFYILRHTGMRFNELWSLPAAALHSGALEGPLDKTLKEVGISYYGYIFLESQGTPNRTKDPMTKKWVRKPLKGRKRIDMKGARTIPVSDKTCWNILARRYKRIKSKQLDLTQGLFFEACNKSRLEDTLREAYDKLPFKKKVFHCLRHTYATFLIGETRNYFLAQAILGHRSMKIFENYNHIFELMNLRAKSKSQVIEEIA